MYGAAPPAQEDGSSALLCLVIFLMVLLVFRGAHNVRTCEIVVVPEAQSYVELPAATADTPAGGELKSPPVACYSAY